MTEQQNSLAQLFANCWKDEALKARFMSDPKAVLAEYDMPVPDGMDVNVVENSDNCVHITFPARPANASDLADHELAAAVGGSYNNANCTGLGKVCSKVLTCQERAE